MMIAALRWLFDPEPAPIPLDADDRAVLRSVLWGALTRAAMPQPRRCHLRNLSARGLLEKSGRGRQRCWVLTQRGLESVSPVADARRSRA